MIPVDSIQTFFEHHNYTNYKNSFVAKDYVKGAKVGNLIYHFFDLDIDASSADYKAPED